MWVTRLCKFTKYMPPAFTDPISSFADALSSLPDRMMPVQIILP
jgi:hypothetical protein